MSSNYVGVDSFSPNLALMTDGDSPIAAVFRLPNERLLDNDVHVRNRVAAVETRTTNLEIDSTDTETRLVNLETISGFTALTTTTASITARNLATRSLAANEAVAGTKFKYSATVQVARGSTATATNISLRITVGGVFAVLLIDALNVTNGYTGSASIEGEISFHSAPGAAAAFTVNCTSRSTVVSATPVFNIVTPDLTLVAATNAPVDIVMLAFLSAPTAGVSFTPVSAYITRLHA